ncbi:hypothetical protein [Streptomyces sp. NPDC017673]|uniref:hypothetical protein n=1 Tax=Streptomyces sp. NPDC017673 TaxID=3365005 RepID=UPI0037B9DF67
MSTVRTEEHHAADDNRLPSRFAFAGAVSGATDRIAVTLTAVIGPLHALLRPAKQIAVPDLLGGVRRVTVAGIGHRSEEYALSGVDGTGAAGSRANRVQTLLTAWTGEEFTHRRGRVRLTPRPYTDPYPLPAGRAAPPGAPPAGPPRQPSSAGGPPAGGCSSRLSRPCARRSPRRSPSGSFRHWRAQPSRPAVRHRRPRSGQWPGRGRRTVRGEGSGDLALLPEFGGPRYEAQPISSRDLPFVSLTNFRTNGMESAAKTV